MKDWKLEDKAVRDLSNNPIPNYYWQQDVKEFIKKLKEEIPFHNNTIDKLAGKSLVEKESQK